MVYDCFQFFNEIDILRLRMNILKDVVDKFVISEATITFSGDSKPLYFAENRELFKEFEDKIIYNLVEDTPDGTTFERDTFQKGAVARGLVNCKEEDIIIFSDVDEIPNPTKVTEIVANFNQDIIYHFAQRMFYCYLNNEEISGNLQSVSGEFDGIKKRKWLGTRICSYKIAENLNLEDLRRPEKKEQGVRIDDGGWHFGYMGGIKEASVLERIQYKVKSAAHQEFNNSQTFLKAEKNIKNGMDILGRKAEFKRVEINDTFPQYLREHIKEYDYLIMPKAKLVNELFLNVKRSMRKGKNFFFCFKRKIREILTK